MRLSRLYVIFALVTLVSCENPVAEEESTTSPSVDEDSQVENGEEVEEAVQPNEEVSDILKIRDPLGLKDSQMPILPPLILLDFADDDDDNSTSSEEKSKRTIDKNLGYGFGRNDLFSGKTNYYFPAGKSGTTVSIEASISPFQPKTIIETVKPISEKPYPGDQNSGYGLNPLQQKNLQPVSVQQNNSPTGQSVKSQPSIRYSQPVFGQRTKLYKPSQIDYNAYQGFSSTLKSNVQSFTTPRPDYRVNSFTGSQNTFSTPRPSFSSSTAGFSSGFPQSSHTTPSSFVSYSTPQSVSFVTPTSSPYQIKYNTANSYTTPRPSYDAVTTPRPSNLASQTYSQDSPFAQFSNLPRYTVENGVRYENKIVWKYSDGKVSQTPPASYINAYNEFLLKQSPGAVPPSYQNVGSGASGSYQSGIGASYQNFGSQSSFQNPNYQNTLLKYQEAQQARPSSDSFSNIYSQSPAQFPNDQEPNAPSRGSQFGSSASGQPLKFGIGSKGPQPTLVSPSQAYDFDYQGQFGLKTSLRAGSPSSYSASSKENTKLLKDSFLSAYEEKRLIPKYAVNSDDPEYTYSTESAVKSTTPTSSKLFTASGSLSPNILSKYSTPAQKYLTKVFSPGKSTSQDYQPTTPNPSDPVYSTASPPFINTDYENLLNYNPSISQYIRNPSSILKAQPTYVQAGNSLIPVIILRVDGAPPIQPKVTPNINLKALLQQYLTQYAGSAGQNGNGDFGGSQAYSGASNEQQSPIHQLTRLTQTLSQYSQDPSIANNLAKQFDRNRNQNAYQTSDLYPPLTNYDDLGKTRTSGSSSYTSRTSKPKKIKNVQIIEDPRYTSYKVNS